MTALKSDTMTADEFLGWCLTKEDSYELIDGVPQMTVDARKAHDRVMQRALRRVDARLAGGRCEPFSDDLAVRVSPTSVLRPDVVVDCGDSDGDLLVADKPVLLIEVLSKSTRSVDLLRKSIEYKTISSLRHMLFLEPDRVAGASFQRLESGHWTDMWIIGREPEILMPEINVSLTLGDFYEGLDL